MKEIMNKVNRKKSIGQFVVILFISILIIALPFEGAILTYAESESAIAYLNSQAANEMYLVYHYRSGDCYLSSNMYMLRRRAFLDGMDWSGIKKDIDPDAYDGGMGSLRKTAAYDDGSTYNSMKLDYYFSYGSRTYNVREGKLPGGYQEKVEQLCKLLDEHPEGIAAHGTAHTQWGSWPHSVLLTHYREEGGEIQFYAVDSAYNTVSNNTAYGGWNSSWTYFNVPGVQKIENTQIPSVSYLTTYKYIANVTPRQVETPAASTVWERLYGAGRYDTMEEIIDEGFSAVGGTVVIASGETFKDALPASGLAGLYDAPVVITSSKALSTQAKSVLERLRPSRVLIAGGSFAVSDDVQREVEEVTGVSALRIMGANSAATSAELALAGSGRWSSDKTAVIATNSGFKDALSVAPIAYAKKYPILLADGGKSLSGEVLSALDELGIENVIIVGGTGAVNRNVEAQLAERGISVRERLGGANGAETSAIIARWGLNNGLSANNMGVATSQSFPDALSGAAFCGHNRAVLVLADDRAISNASFPAAYKDEIKRAYVFGGTSAVGLTTWNKLVESVS